ncbi:MAG: hypothetical protein ACM3U2_13510, partial [Deltaproteobacteria bacterium]
MADSKNIFTRPPLPPLAEGVRVRWCGAASNLARGETASGAFDRRAFLWQFGGGLGGIALAHLLGESGLLADEKSAGPRAEFNGGLHHRAKAKRVVQLFMSGAASQCDMFD